ncbi:DUF5319 family protein [Corynebacterium sp. 13CS0277]|uniref:DUF5319 family protein n=1 Tax=Corynebacterium sp. 13CS0277 TaxID=2071994 RepID=UPI001E2B15FE|nr:DUF5319 family protein [Corynebacterium sp. 13CS0277]
MFPNELPLDPFANDPNDPAKLLDDLDDFPVITPKDRQDAAADLQTIQLVRPVLSLRGVDGTCFTCEDCEQVHYYPWDMLEAAVRATMNGEVAPIHEPAVNQDPTRYVSWDYLLGYADGMMLS